MGRERVVPNIGDNDEARKGRKKIRGPFEQALACLIVCL